MVTANTHKKHSQVTGPILCVCLGPQTVHTQCVYGTPATWMVARGSILRGPPFHWLVWTAELWRSRVHCEEVGGREGGRERGREGERVELIAPVAKPTVLPLIP